MADVTLLFGIGATKAGTSWLHAWLSGHPEVHLWPHKELHYFDALDDGRVMQQIDHICERRATLRARMKTTTEPERLQRLAFRVAELDRYLGLIGPGRLDPAAYMAFLTGLTVSTLMLMAVGLLYQTHGFDEIMSSLQSRAVGFNQFR